MNEQRAHNVVVALRGQGVDAQVARSGVYRFGVTVTLGDGRQALWDADGTAGIEAQVLRDGVLVGFVPVIEGSSEFDESQVVKVIAGADYDRALDTPIPGKGRAAAAPANARHEVSLRRILAGLRHH